MRRMGKARLANPFTEKFPSNLRPGRVFQRGLYIAAKGKMLETATEQVLRSHAPDGLRISHHIDQAGNFHFPMPHHNGWQPVGHDFLRPGHIPEDDPIRFTRFQQRLNLLRSEEHTSELQSPMYL